MCVFIGKRETGKSFLVRDLLYYHQDIPGNCYIWNRICELFLWSYVTSLFIHDQFTPELIHNTLKRQKMVVSKKEKKKKLMDKVV